MILYLKGLARAATVIRKIKKEPLPTPKTGIDRGFWFVFRAFKQVPKSTLILALLLELCGEYNHTGRSFLVALRLAITGFFDP